MPPVLGPVSPSWAGLWSWAGVSVTIVRPSVIASTLASWPSSRSSMMISRAGVAEFALHADPVDRLPAPRRDCGRR